MLEVPGYKAILGSERRPVPGARRVGPADPDERFAFTIRIRRRPDSPALPRIEDWVSRPPGRRRFLSPDQLRAQYGASPSDLNRVAEFALRCGFEIVQTSLARRTIRASATVRQANKIFGVDLGRYESPEQKYRGREGFVNVPVEVADYIVGVFGLDNRRMARRSGGGAPSGAVALTGGPPQVAALYNFPPLDAPGQTVGILEFGGGQVQSDLEQFCSALGIPAPTPILVSVDGQSTDVYDHQSDVEVALDVQTVAAIAQGAKIVVFFAPFCDAGWLDAVTTAIYESPVPLTALSISWGLSEDQWDTSGVQNLSEAFGEAALIGTSIFASNGDWGSNNQDNDGNPHVNYPASDPWVTSCGGTFIANPTSLPFTEGTWNDKDGATGGGLSVPSGFSGGTGFEVPFWQGDIAYTPVTAEGVKQSSKPLSGRGVPDVAGNASPFSGYSIVTYGKVFGSGGNSAVCPLYAGLAACVAAQRGSPLGYLNPTLYKIAGSIGQKTFVDIDDGATNELDVAVTLPSGDTPTPCAAYATTTGWDACTGLGRIDGLELLGEISKADELLQVQPDNPFDFPCNFPPNWMAGQGNGADDTGDNVCAGQQNTADNYSLGSDLPGAVDYNNMNGGDYGSDLFGDVTLINTAVAYGATLAGDNIYLGQGSIGIFGRSRGVDFSIGVMGQSSKGCAIYGLATDDSPGDPAHQPSHGIGVVGRSMGGLAPEPTSVENMMGVPIGVLGHAVDGPGVRGHGGPLQTLAWSGETLQTGAWAPPGGVFSSGQLEDNLAINSGGSPTVSGFASAQLRLIPSVAKRLPSTANVGDLFLVQRVEGQEPRLFTVAELYLCTYFSDGVPQWQQIQLQTPAIAGGKSL